MRKRLVWTCRETGSVISEAAFTSFDDPEYDEKAKERKQQFEAALAKHVKEAHSG